MMMRIAATVSAIGLIAGLSGAGPARAEPLAAADAATQTQGTAEICQRKARIDVLSAPQLFDLYAREIAMRGYILQTENTFGSVDDIMQDVAQGTTGLPTKADVVIAEQQALLPETAQDLPLLMLLAQYENTGTPIMALALSSDFALLPELVEALQRQGLPETRRALALAQVALPHGIKAEDIWAGGASPETEAKLATAKAGLEVAERLYPTGSAGMAAVAMIGNDPVLKTIIAATLTADDEHGAMYWLLDQLWTSCYQDTYSADAAERAYGALGTPQAAILLLDIIVMEGSEGSLEYYFAGPSGNMVPATARVLDIRGLTAEAEALRTGMALFGTPFPREDWARSEAMGKMTDDQLAQLAALSAVLYEDVLWAEMVLIAREAGLLPGPATDSPP